jgi:hypothetical protein
MIPCYGCTLHIRQVLYLKSPDLAMQSTSDPVSLSFSDLANSRTSG